MTTKNGAVRFAEIMRRIPRRVQRCDVYGTGRIVVDRAHATAVLRKIAPTATGADIYAALNVLQDRLDERAAVPA